MNSVLQRVYEIGIIPVIAFNNVDGRLCLYGNGRIAVFKFVFIHLDHSFLLVRKALRQWSQRFPRLDCLLADGVSWGLGTERVCAADR